MHCKREREGKKEKKKQKADGLPMVHYYYY